MTLDESGWVFSFSTFIEQSLIITVLLSEMVAFQSSVSPDT